MDCNTINSLTVPVNICVVVIALSKLGTIRNCAMRTTHLLDLVSPLGNEHLTESGFPFVWLYHTNVYMRCQRALCWVLAVRSLISCIYFFQSKMRWSVLVKVICQLTPLYRVQFFYWYYINNLFKYFKTKYLDNWSLSSIDYSIHS